MNMAVHASQAWLHFRHSTCWLELMTWVKIKFVALNVHIYAWVMKNARPNFVAILAQILASSAILAQISPFYLAHTAKASFGQCLLQKWLR